MITLRLFDRDRQPPDWTEIIRPGQYVAFSKTIDTGGSCDQDGRPFASAADATCLLFDGLTEARAFCEEQVTRAPAVRFEIFDSAGRRDPALLVIVHPSRIATLEGNPRGIRLRKWAASALLAGAVLLFWYDYRHDEGMLIFPTVLGINMVIIAARLIQLNGAYVHAERLRQKRLAEHSVSLSKSQNRSAELPPSHCFRLGGGWSAPSKAGGGPMVSAALCSRTDRDRREVRTPPT